MTIAADTAQGPRGTISKEKTIGGLRGKAETTVLAKGIGAEAIQKRYANGMIVCMTAYVAVACCLASIS